MMIRLVFAAALLAIPALPQDVQRSDARAARSAEADAIFYRAFYLYRGERRHAQALELYREFLKKAPRSRFAGRALDDASAILTRGGKADDARELRDQHRARVKALDQVQQKKGADAAGTVSARDQVEPKMTADQRAALTERLAELEKELLQAEKAGDLRTVRRLTRQISTGKRQLNRGVVPSSRGDRRRG